MEERLDELESVVNALRAQIQIMEGQMEDLFNEQMQAFVVTSLQQYDRALPEKVQAINRNPRRIG